jgi:hypothetical protein
VPNGNPHDNPYSDVVFWKRRVFSVELDTLLAEIHALHEGREHPIPEDLADQLLLADPSLDGPAPAANVIATLQAEVQTWRDRRRAEATARGMDTESVLAPIRAEVRRRWSESSTG